MKQIRFYEGYPFPDGCLHSWHATELAINARKEVICTSQMAFLSTNLFEKGYRVFIYPPMKSGYEPYELKLGDGTFSKGRPIQITHNLFNLWASGEFEGPLSHIKAPDAERIAALRSQYCGAQVRLTCDLEDPFTPLPAGLTGTVETVDDMGQLHCKWSNGSTLAIDPDIDSVEQCDVLPPPI